MRDSGDWLLCDSYIPLSAWQRSRARDSINDSRGCRIMCIMLNALAKPSVHAGFSDDRPGGTLQIFSHLYPAIAPVPTIRIINLFRSVLH